MFSATVKRDMGARTRTSGRVDPLATLTSISKDNTGQVVYLALSNSEGERL